MKICFAVLTSLILSCFACESSALKAENVVVNPTPTASIVSDYNLNKSQSFPVEQSQANQFEAQNEKFKVKPENFKQIDFKNFSYPYEFSYSGRKLNFTLKNEEYQFDFKGDKGWFSFSDVFYVDLTDDDKPEAIVMLWHVSCGVSCDGGAGLFYVYASSQNKPLWQFETGSLGYGCGLKSFTVKDKKVTMDLFGQCFDEKDLSATGKFLVNDTTRLMFGFNGKKFVEEKKEFVSVPVRSVLSYRPEISINE